MNQRWLVLGAIAVSAGCVSSGCVSKGSKDPARGLASEGKAAPPVEDNDAFRDVPSRIRQIAREIFDYRKNVERGYRKNDPAEIKKAEADAGRTEPSVRRDTHAKTHACAMAEMQVNPDIPAEFRVGTFANPGESHKAWIRWANGLGGVNHDLFGDARSMSMKVMGVRAHEMSLAGFPEEEKYTHDFVMNNAPTFFVDGADDAREFFKAESDGVIKEYFGKGLLPFVHQDRKKVIFNALLLGAKVEPNLLTATYWSSTPYRFGNKAVKYIARPCADRSFKGYATLPTMNKTEKDYLKGLHHYYNKWSPVVGNHDFNDLGTVEYASFLTDAVLNLGAGDKVKAKFDPKSFNFLRANVSQDLSAGREGCFELGVEQFVDEAVTPIEKATVYWRTKATWLARVKIPAQKDVASDSRLAFCEGLSFNAWHAPKEHQPVGELNAVRGMVYKMMSAHRHERNGKPAGEPLENQEMKLATPTEAAAFYSQPENKPENKPEITPEITSEAK